MQEKKFCFYVWVLVILEKYWKPKEASNNKNKEVSADNNWPVKQN